MSKVVTDEIMQELINKLEDIINNYCYNLEPYTDDEVDELFQATSEQINYYNSIINDNIESKNFIWSSKKVAEQIASAIIESQSYTDSLIKNISSIKLKYVTALPTSDISESTIYILKSANSTSKDTLNLYNPTDGWTSIGDFTISMDDYYDKTEIDNLLANKANKTEVLTPDNIKTDLTATDLTNSEVVGALATKTAIDNKVSKSDIVTTINSSSTDDTIPSAKAVYTELGKKENVSNKVTTINSSSTDTQYPSALAVYTATKIASGYAEKSVDDCNNCIITGYYVASSTCINVPSGEKYGILKVYGRRTDIESSTSQWIIQEYTSTSGKRYIRSSVNANSLMPTNWGSWKRLCNTVVYDVDKTNIVWEGDILTTINEATYHVKNGICYIDFNAVAISLTENKSGIIVAKNLPKPTFSKYINHANWGLVSGILFNISSAGNLSIWCDSNNNGRNLYGSFSYPVKES